MADWDDSTDPIPYWDDGGGGSSDPGTGGPSIWDDGPIASPHPAIIPPVEIDSRRQSNSVYRIVDLIGLGEIEGLVNGEESVYLNGTPLKEGGDYNFDDTVIIERFGTPDQSYIPDLNNVENTIAVNEELKYDPGQPEYSSTKVISDTDVDRVRITITLSTLYWMSDEGEYLTTECDFGVDIRPNGGDWYTIIHVGREHGFYFKGISKSPYQKTVEISLPSVDSYGSGGGHPYDIRCYRGTPDSEDDVHRNSVSTWTSYTEVIGVKLTYPHCALIGGIFNARSTGGSIPSRIYHVRGRKIKVPTNYTPYVAATYVDVDTFTVVGDQTSIFAAGATLVCNCGNDGYLDCEVASSSFDSPITTVNLTGGSDNLTSNLISAERVYTGAWDGTFQTLWSSNNAWVFYDLVNNGLIGVPIDPSYIDKWTLYTIAQRCDGLVDDGYGNKEPRYQFNGIIKTRYDAVSLFNIIATTFKSMCYQGPSLITLSQDKPTSSTKIFTNADVIDGVFHYEGTGLKEIYTAALVMWNSPDDLGAFVPEYVKHTYGIHRYGYKEIRITPRGLNSRGQAHRYGKDVLDTSVSKPDRVRFRASFKAIDIMPGEVVKISDQFYGDKRFGFRVVTASGTTVDVEGIFVKEGGETYTIYLEIRDGDDLTALESRTISDASDLGNGNTRLTISSEFTSDPGANEVVIIAQTDDPEENVREFRAITISEVKPNIFEILGIEYDPDKYARVEGNIEFDDTSVVRLPPRLSPPTNIEVVEFTYREGQNNLFGLTVSWELSPDPRVEKYKVQYEKYSSISGDPLDYFTVGRVEDPFFQIKPIDTSGSGTIKYKVRIRATNRLTSSAWVESDEITIVADPDGPSDITGLQVKGGGTEYTGVDCLIEWDDMRGGTNARLKDYRIRVYRTNDTLLATEYRPDPYFTYTFEQNREDNHLEDGGNAITSLRFRVDCRDVYDKFSDTPTLLNATIAALSTPTNLSVQGGGNSFTGKDCYIVWDDMYSSSDRLVDYRIRIRRNDDTLLATEYSPDPWFNYSFEQNKEDNYAEDTGWALPVLKFQVECRNGFGNLSATPATLTATNPVPANISGEQADGRMGGVDFEWAYNTEQDFLYYTYRFQIESAGWSNWFNSDGNRAQRMLTSTEKTTHGYDANIQIQIKAVDVFKQPSASAVGANADCLGLAVAIADVPDYLLTPSKFSIPLPLVDGLTITNNSPSSGFVAWTGFNLYLSGTKYVINAGNSENEFICFKDLATTLVEIDDHPSEEYANWDPTEDFLIIWNSGGTGKKAWSTFMNLVATSAFIGAAAIETANIGNLAVTNAHINDLNASKINAGSISVTYTDADVTADNETFSQHSDIDALQTTNAPAASGADVTADNETFSQNSDIDALQTTNAPAAANADVTSSQFTNALNTIDSQVDRSELGFDSNGSLITKVLPAVAVGADPGITGLFLGSDYMGYFDNGINAWRTYMDSSGNFYLGGTSGKLRWNGSALTLEGSIVITGGSGIASLTDAGALATRSDIGVGDLQSGVTDRMPAATAISGGKIVLTGNGVTGTLSVTYTDADVTSDNETFSQHSDIDALQTTNAPAAAGADVTANNETFSQHSDIDALQTTNAPAAAGADVTANNETFSQHSDIDALQTTNAPAAAGADVTADNETFSQNSDINVLLTTNAPAASGADVTANNAQNLNWLDGSAGTLTISSTGSLAISATAGILITSGGGIIIQGGGDLEIQSGGDVIVKLGGSIVLEEGGDLKLYGDASNPAQIEFYDIASNLASKIVSKEASLTQWLPNADSTKDLYFGNSSTRFDIIRLYADGQIDVNCWYNGSNYGWASFNCGNGANNWVRIRVASGGSEAVYEFKNDELEPTDGTGLGNNTGRWNSLALKPLASAPGSPYQGMFVVANWGTSHGLRPVWYNGSNWMNLYSGNAYT